MLREQKKLLEIDKVKYVNVPHYEELSVKQYWPILRQDEKLMQYMPDFPPGDKIPERSFFWNVANTVQYAYVQKVIQHANEQRMKAVGEERLRETIEISEKWYDKLNALPFVSCK